MRARTNELLILRATLDLPRPQLVVLSGQRRVGKTFLVQHALAGLDRGVVGVYFETTQAGQSAELRRFHQNLIEKVGSDLLPPGPPPTSWEQALRLAAFVARHQPMVVAIDEATY